MSNRYDIKIDQGSTFSIGLTIRDSAGVPINLTGHSFRGQIRKTVSASKIEAEFSFDVQDQTANPGRVTCYLSADDTEAIKVDQSPSAQRIITKMAYDIESETLDGTVVRWLEGIAEISPEATK
jgi:hypothetical protein